MTPEGPGGVRSALGKISAAGAVPDFPRGLAMPAPNKTPSFVSPQLPPGTFGTQARAANTARIEWCRQFRQANQVATAAGVGLPLAMLAHWYHLSNRALFDYNDLLFGQRDDWRELAEEVRLFDRPVANGRSLGTLLDQSPGRCEIYERESPISRTDGWKLGGPHALEMPAVLGNRQVHSDSVSLCSSGATLTADQPQWKRITFADFLTRASFLLNDPGGDDPGYSWPRSLSYNDGDGADGRGGPRLVDCSAGEYERDEAHPWGGCIRPYGQPDYTVWRLNDAELPAWRVQVREFCRHAAQRAADPLPASIANGAFAALADHLIVCGGKTSCSSTGQEKRPSAERRKLILAALREAAEPLQREGLRRALRLPTEGTLGRDLAWMVKNQELDRTSDGYVPTKKT